jgi:flagellar basal-body rod protein FlgF
MAALWNGACIPGAVMDPIWVTAASGMRARMEALDVLGNNIANAATDGYKGDRELYNLHFSNASRYPNSTVALPVIEGQWTDFSQGLLQTTDNPLDFALRGDGFFAVNGPSGPLYTRSGSFRLSKTGTLETKEGYTVRLAGVDGPLKVEGNDPIEVSADGSVRQAGQTLGRLEVVRFDDEKVLSKQAGSFFEANRGAKPVAAAGADVLQGKVEASNVSSADSAVRIVSVMRQFEMLQKAISLASEMDRQIIHEVAKVGQ